MFLWIWYPNRDALTQTGALWHSELYKKERLKHLEAEFIDVFLSKINETILG